MAKDLHPELEQRRPQTYVSKTETVTMDTIGRAADRIPEIIGWLGEHGVTPAGPPFLRYLVIDMGGTVAAEAGVPVADSAVPSVEQSGYELRSLPAGQYVTATHQGHFDRLQDANAAVLAWADENGITWDMSEADDGQHWACRLETYVTNPSEQPDPSQWITVIAIKTA